MDKNTKTNQFETKIECAVCTLRLSEKRFEAKKIERETQNCQKIQKK